MPFHIFLVKIVYVDPNGLAASHGLQPYASSVSCAGGGSRCNWVLTEINNRPLSLFFKDNEVNFNNFGT